jgi:hypothetical protein
MGGACKRREMQAKPELENLKEREFGISRSRWEDNNRIDIRVRG